MTQPVRIDIAPGSLVNLVPGRVFDPVARAAMKVVVDWVDKPVADDAPAAQRRRRPKVAGVYRVGRELVLEGADRLDGDKKATRGQPYLVLLHGTFSRPSD